MNKNIEPKLQTYNLSIQELPDIAAVIHQRMNRKYFEVILRELSEELITLGYSLTNDPKFANEVYSDLREVQEAIYYAFMRGKYPDMPANEIYEKFKVGYCDGDSQLLTTHFVEVLSELGMYLEKNND
ncbi:hypothetical protein SI60_22615 [Salmonella enterica]|nr:hypothetical protein [Salmonella enterica]EBP3183660.1 hypothetical protein [Salmonella enterica]